MKKKLFRLIVIFHVLGSVVFAGGQKDIASRDLVDLSAWEEKLDISSAKTGKCNILITATDFGGNISVAGPYNMWIDPKSDLPIVGITNPYSGMRIPGNLNIVGTAVDDDAVASVEVILDGDTANPRRADGTTFWSYYLDTKNLAEGVHTISVYAIDINGLKGLEKKVIWHLDRNAPAIGVNNVDLGALVRGKVNFQGTILDGNGIESISYSVDNGQKFIPLPFKVNKKDGLASFSLVVDTTKVADGSSLCWFKAVDKQGTVGYYTFLYFVDNTKPDIKVLSHAPGDKINGVFSLAGQVTDAIGIKSFTWTIGKETGEIKLSPGNPYWVQEFDVRKEKSSAVEILFKATDTIGNTKILKYKLKIDPNLDLPTIALVSPKGSERIQKSLPLIGYAKDDDGIAKVLYSVNDATPIEIITEGAFCEEIPLSAGKHKIQVWAEDVHGVAGKKSLFTVESIPPKPQIALQSISLTPSKAKPETKLYLPGLTLDGTAKIAMNLQVTAPKGYTSLSWTLNAAEPVVKQVKETRPVSTYSILLPDLSSAVGGQKLKVSVADEYGSVTEALYYFIIEAADASLPAELSFDGKTDEKGRFLLQNNQSLSGFYTGGMIVEAIFQKPTPDLTIAIEGRSIVISALQDGVYDVGSLNVIDDSGGSYKTEPLSFVADNNPPNFTIVSPKNQIWVQNKVMLELLLPAAESIKKAEYSFDNGNSWTDAHIVEGAVKQELSVNGVADGLVVFSVRATDVGGLSTTKTLAFIKDTLPPSLKVVTPPAEKTINGETLVSIFASDEGKLSAVEYHPPLADIKKAFSDPVGAPGWTALPVKPLTGLTVGTSTQPLNTAMVVRAFDKAGNILVKNSWEFVIDSQSDKPVVEIHIPAENAVVTKDFVVSGIVLDDDGVSKIWYKVDDKDFVALDATSNFALPFSLADFVDNEHTVTIYAEDVYGVKGDPVVRKFRVSLSEPKGTVRTPDIASSIKGFVEITGTAEDANGVADVKVSVDNGNTWNDAIGTTSWTYKFDTNIIEDGTHALFYRITDKYGIEGMYSSLINIDNTPPELLLELPVDSTETSGKLFITGYASDSISLAKVYVKIRGLDSNQGKIPENLAYVELPPEKILGAVLDIQQLPEGLYNVEVTIEDKAQNSDRVSRNVRLDKKVESTRIDILYPLNGEYVNGVFKVYGKVTARDPLKNVILYIDKINVEAAEVTGAGYFSFSLSPEKISKGSHLLSVKGVKNDDALVASRDTAIHYTTSGPWITVDNFTMGDFALERPWLKGTVGYAFAQEDIDIMTSKKMTKEQKEYYASKTVAKVEVSMDNGKNFKLVGDKKNWRYRIETQDMSEGAHFMLARVTMKSGETAITRSIIQIDKTLPHIRLISPSEGQRFNNSITFTGISSDNIKLDAVNIKIRPGDKSNYGVPGFIQGLYLDVHAWGATLYDVGLGLTFFDDNVKLQAQFGQFTREQRAAFAQTPARYGGNVFGFKLLANVFTLPFAYMFGPDFTWLSASCALGANFSLFSDTQSGRPQVLSAVIGQLEFPKAKIPKMKFFSQYSFYTEFQLWFIPSDVGSADIVSVLPHVSFGARMGLF